MNPRHYILTTYDGGIRGVYSSEENLKKGVDYWMREFPNQTLAYEKWQLDYPFEPSEWEWCYIAPNDSADKLAKGGGRVPVNSFWGKNLVGIEW